MDSHAPRHNLALARMVANTTLDVGVGAIPLIGDAWDFFFKSNRRNLRLLERELANCAALQNPHSPLRIPNSEFRIPHSLFSSVRLGVNKCVAFSQVAGRIGGGKCITATKLISSSRGGGLLRICFGARMSFRSRNLAFFRPVAPHDSAPS